MPEKNHRTTDNQLERLQSRIAELEKRLAEAGEGLRDETGELYRALIERAADGISIIQDGVVVFANDRACDVVGRSFEEMAGQPFELFVDPRDRERLAERYRRRMRGEVVPSTYEAGLLHKDGHTTQVEINAGRITHRRRPADLAVFRDITERRNAERHTRMVEQRIRRLHETAAELSACASEEEVLKVAIGAAEQILSLSICTLDLVEGDRLVVKALSTGAPQDASESRPIDDGGLAAKTLRTGRSYVFGTLSDVPEARPTRPGFESGVSVPIGSVGVLQAASTERGAFDEDDVRVVEILARHTASALVRIRLQEELRSQAIHDALTGVFNRRYAQEAIESELSRGRHSKRALGLLMVDINRFKEINDRFGHQVGDNVLVGVARALQQAVRGEDSVIRYGGDEFLILIPEPVSEIDRIAERLQRSVARWAATEEAVEFAVTVAIGRACYDPTQQGTWEDVLRLADRRMYEEKQRQSGPVAVRRHADGVDLGRVTP